MTTTPQFGTCLNLGCEVYDLHVFDLPLDGGEVKCKMCQEPLVKVNMHMCSDPRCEYSYLPVRMKNHPDGTCSCGVELESYVLRI